MATIIIPLGIAAWKLAAWGGAPWHAGISLSEQIKELEITSWPGFPSEIGRADIAGQGKGPGSCPGRMLGCGRPGGPALNNSLALGLDTGSI